MMFLAPLTEYMYSEGFDEVTIPNTVLEAILDGVVISVGQY